jgi:glyoxylase-like metal-dependent hydrolase (beta-lactamase superfamily II)
LRANAQRQKKGLSNKAMSAKRYSFKVGRVDCAVLFDGASLLGRDGMMKRFPNGTEEDYRRVYADIGLSLDDADSSLNVLAAKIGNETVLVDSGEGRGTNKGLLLESMRLAGIAPESITLIVITHAHGDHVLGLLSDKFEPVFPNATYVISRPEMESWQARVADKFVDQRPIIMMMQEKGLRLIEMDEQIIPGLTAVPIPGHTPGQIAVLIESEGENMIALADMLHSPMQFAHPEWSPMFDADTNQSVITRRDTLRRAAVENMIALFYHLTFPGLGRVTQAENGFTWVRMTD